MQLVVMAAVLGMTVLGQNCRPSCRPTNMTIHVKSCDKPQSINTVVCEGDCFQSEPVDPTVRPKQTTCHGVWSYEEKHFEGCPVGVVYPVAHSCECSMCQSTDIDCDRILRDVRSCHS
ncbi:hypothetical protein CRUP_009910 [Coryphaenoides rupestris]|nr:hypothetical protein CRUP_009910 [Coryphaenoides rupestris]